MSYVSIVASGVLKGFDPLLNLVLDGTTEHLRGGPVTYCSAFLLVANLYAVIYYVTPVLHVACWCVDQCSGLGFTGGRFSSDMLHCCNVSQACLCHQVL